MRKLQKRDARCNEDGSRTDQREATLALSRGQRLPAPTKEQRAVEQGAIIGNNEP